MSDTTRHDHETDGPALLTPGTPIMCVGPRDRRYYAQLTAGLESNFNGHRLKHDEIIGRPDGCRAISNRKQSFWVFSASLEQHALNMKRSAAIVYPKDLAMLMLGADVRAGMTVVEGGAGSGALSMMILRTVGPGGRLVTYELRDSAATRATRNIEALLGECPNHEIRSGNIYDGIDLPDHSADAIILDVPEPWSVIEHAIQVLIPGGAFAAYVPTAVQMQKLVLRLGYSRHFPWVDCQETLERRWHVTAKSVRPKSTMVGHTGFLVFARKGERDPRNEDAAPPPDVAGFAPVTGSTHAEERDPDEMPTEAPGKALTALAARAAELKKARDT